MAQEIARGITIDPEVMVGKPVINGTRMPVELVFAKLSGNSSVDDLLADHPHLTVAQIQDCLRYAAELADHAYRTGQVAEPRPASRSIA